MIKREGAILRKIVTPDYQTLSSEVYKNLKRGIIACRFKPGQMIYQEDLMALYGVSRTPVREALKQLMQEELVQSLPSIGYVVAAITPHDVREVFGMRRILETSAIEEAIRTGTDEQLEALDALSGESFLLVDDDACLRWSEINNRFHIALAEISGSRRLVRAIRSTLEETVRLSMLNQSLHCSTEPKVAGHHEYVRALRRRDQTDAMSFMLRELDWSLESSLEWIEKQGFGRVEAGSVARPA